MYLGMIGMLSALALAVGSVPFYVVTAGYFMLINGTFCPYEEKKLTETFGADYLSYRQQVRRWL